MKPPQPPPPGGQVDDELDQFLAERLRALNAATTITVAEACAFMSRISPMSHEELATFLLLAPDAVIRQLRHPAPTRPWWKFW